LKILVTGSEGFVGKNLVAELNNQGYKHIYLYTRNSTEEELEEFAMQCDFVYHLAGVNRPNNESEFMEGNFGLTSTLLNKLIKHQNTCPIIISSSTQAVLDNSYGISKKAGEDLLFQYSKDTGAKVLVYRFPNIFGKWCRINYNSAISTFCYNISRELPIIVNDPDVVMKLVYIDDVLDELINALKSNENKIGKYCEVPVMHTIALGKIVELIYSFKKSRKDSSVPNMSNLFEKKLYSTYLSYLPENEFSYNLKMNVDQRGSFTEFIRTPDRGQVSVNISKPGIIKGNHWHHTKNEKFLVVSGKGIIRFRKVNFEEVIEYFVSGTQLKVVDIPSGYTHNIENIGNTDLITLMWANEIFDPEKPDTYYLEV